MVAIFLLEVKRVKIKYLKILTKVQKGEK